MPRLLLLAAFSLTLAGCGYFNSLYNANRQFADAERATRSGDVESAARYYRAAIDGAAVSYRNHPDSRWADDALLVIGRSRFALREWSASAAAMQALLGQTRDPATRGVAWAYVGAARVNLGASAEGEAALDSAVALLREGSEDAAFARLWRGRAGLVTGNPQALADLSQAALSRHSAWEASLVGMMRAADVRDSIQLAAFVQKLASAPFRRGARMQVDSAVRYVGGRWSTEKAFHVTAPLQHGSWPVEARDQIALLRVELARDAGMDDEALEIAMQIAGAVTGGAGSAARHHAARIRLASLHDYDELDDIRQLLIRAFDDPGALQLMRQIRATEILVEQGRTPETALSLFAAAEMARDDLLAPGLAQRFFLDFIELQPSGQWAGKAALAAHMIGATDETQRALDAQASNPYVLLAGGRGDASAVDRAEERLAWGIDGLRADAFAAAIARDALVGRAVSVLDSARSAARLDSVRIACGTLIDSLRVTGIRSDSTRSACLRGDSARVAFVLNADTTLLRDTTSTRARAGRATPVRPDTIN